MISKPTSIQPYMAFKFCVMTSSGKVVDCSAAHHDPFLKGMWIARAHCEGEPTLGSILEHEEQIDVHLISRGREVARKITVAYEGVTWFPIDIDAAVNSVAMEWCLLLHARYMACEDVELKDVPGLAGGATKRNVG